MAKEEKSSTANTSAHKAMKSLYKEGVKKVGHFDIKEHGYVPTKRSTSDGYMPRKLKVESKNTDKSDSDFRSSKTYKRGETRFGNAVSKVKQRTAQ